MQAIEVKLHRANRSIMISLKIVHYPLILSGDSLAQPHQSPHRSG